VGFSPCHGRASGLGLVAGLPRVPERGIGVGAAPVVGVEPLRGAPPSGKSTNAITDWVTHAASETRTETTVSSSSPRSRLRSMKTLLRPRVTRLASMRVSSGPIRVFGRLKVRNTPIAVPATTGTHRATGPLRLPSNGRATSWVRPPHGQSAPGHLTPDPGHRPIRGSGTVRPAGDAHPVAGTVTEDPRPGSFGVHHHPPAAGDRGAYACLR